MNYRVTKDALKAGKHVIVEKPIAANLVEAKKMLRFQRRYPRVMMVAENFRYRPVFHRVKRYLTERTIGHPYAAMWNIFHHMTAENKYARTEWRLHHQYPGGFITDGGVHNIAALRFLFGEIISGTAFTTSVNPSIGRPDTMSFQFATQSGVEGVLSIFFSVIGYRENQLLIFGDKGSLRVSENTITLKRKSKLDQVEVVEDDGGYEEEFANFYSAIRRRHKVLSSFTECYRDLEVIIGALNSAASGKRLEPLWKTL